MRVLLIDDDADFLRSLARLLKGYEVETSSSAAEAFALVAAGRFDVILCDVHMPGMSGPKFIERLSALDAARVIFISGGAYENGDPEFLAAHRALMKPFTRSEIVAAMNAVVEAGAPVASEVRLTIASAAGARSSKTSTG